MTTLRDEDITTTNTLPGGEPGQSDTPQVDPLGTDGSDSDSSDSTETETETEIDIEPRKSDADSSDS